MAGDTPADQTIERQEPQMIDLEQKLDKRLDQAMADLQNDIERFRQDVKEEMSSSLAGYATRADVHAIVESHLAPIMDTLNGISSSLRTLTTLGELPTQVAKIQGQLDTFIQVRSEAMKQLGEKVEDLLGHVEQVQESSAETRKKLSIVWRDMYGDAAVADGPPTVIGSLALLTATQNEYKSAIVNLQTEWVAFQAEWRDYRETWKRRRQKIVQIMTSPAFWRFVSLVGGGGLLTSLAIKFVEVFSNVG